MIDVDINMMVVTVDKEDGESKMSRIVEGSNYVCAKNGSSRCRSICRVSAPFLSIPLSTCEHASMQLFSLAGFRIPDQ